MKIIAANWKMNHCFDETDEWLEVFLKHVGTVDNWSKKVEAVLCPPAILLDYIDSELMEGSFDFLEEVMKQDGREFEDYSAEELNEILIRERPIKIGAQDCHDERKGSFTGNMSATMLTKVGCQYVILGHSERRTHQLESDALVAKKVKAALDQKLIPIICVGESKEMRDQGKHLAFVKNQILNSVPQDVTFETLIIAYEPIWSIGTGIVPSLEQIAEMSEYIHQIFAENFAGNSKEQFMLYGGSVTSLNSQKILKIDNIGGLLVGGASLDAEEFIKICTFE